MAVTFYFLGAYMQEYKINITKIKWIFINSIVLCVSTLFTIIKSGNGTIYTGASTNYWGWQTVLLSITIFGFISNSKINVAVPVKKILVRISNMTLPMYLGSYIADQVIYNVLLKSNEVVSNWYIYFLPAIVGVFAISFLIALLVLEVYKVYNVIKKNSMLYLSK